MAVRTSPLPRADEAFAAALYVLKTQAPGALERAIEQAWNDATAELLSVTRDNISTRRLIVQIAAKAVRDVQRPFLEDALRYLRDSHRSFKSKQVERAREILELLNEQ